MSEVEGNGGSAEEQAEAEKFNEMVNKGKVTPAYMAQIEKDKTPEEVEAEKAAMEKLIDISKGEFYAHQTKSSGLNEILTKGLFSPAYAERLRRYGIGNAFDSQKIKEIKELEGGRWWKPSGDLVWTMSGENYASSKKAPSREGWIEAMKGLGDVVILMDQKLNEKETHRDRGPTFARRINPRYFIGLITYPEPRDQVVDLGRKFGLPVYNLNFELVFPRQMTHEEVQQFIAVRDAKKKEGEESNTSTH